MPVQFEIKAVRGLGGALRRLGAIPPGFRREAARALAREAAAVVRDAADRSPKRTRRLSGSGRVVGPAASGPSVRAGARFGSRKAFYGRFVHEGTRRLRGQRFLSDAGEERLPETDRAMVRALDAAVRGSR